MFQDRAKDLSEHSQQASWIPWDLQYRERRTAGPAWRNNRNPSGQGNRKTNSHRCTGATTLLMPWTPPPWILSITLVLFPLLSIVLRPTRLHTLVISFSAKTHSQPQNKNSQESKSVSDKCMLNLKHQKFLSARTDCTLTKRQTEQNINYRRCSKNKEGGFGYR